MLTTSTCDTADFDTKMRGYNIGDGNFDPNTLPDILIACNDDGTGCTGFTSILTFQVEAGVSDLVALGGYLAESGSGTVAFTFTPEAAGCGDPAAGSCCDPQPLPFCNDGACCDTVCAIDAFCCESQWDAACANLAFENCSPLCGEPIPPQTCSAPGANPLDSNNDDSLATGGIACQADGITTPNTYARVFTQSELGAVYSFSCVNFGLDNSGSYLEGEIGVWIDENGGEPSINDVVLLQSYPVGLYNGDNQLVTVTGDSLCVELTGNQTLVVTLSIPQAIDGFVTFAGGTSSNSETYILSDACGFADFATLTSIDFPDTHWFAQALGQHRVPGQHPRRSQRRRRGQRRRPEHPALGVGHGGSGCRHRRQRQRRRWRPRHPALELDRLIPSDHRFDGSNVSSPITPSGHRPEGVFRVAASPGDGTGSCLAASGGIARRVAYRRDHAAAWLTRSVNPAAISTGREAGATGEKGGTERARCDRAVRSG